MAQSDFDTAALALTGIQHYWKLTETSGTTAADSKGTTNLTWGADVSGFLTTGPDGVASVPVNNGSTSRVAINSTGFAPPATATYFWWQRQDVNATDDGMAFELADSPTFSQFVQALYNYSGGGTAAGKALYSVNYGAAGSCAAYVTKGTLSQWDFYALVIDPSLAAASQVAIVKNGTLVSTNLSATSQSALTPATMKIGVLGRNNNGTRSLPIKAAVCGLGVTNTAMTVAQLAALQASMSIAMSASDSGTGSEASSPGVVTASDAFTDTDSTALTSHSPTGGVGTWQNHPASGVSAVIRSNRAGGPASGTAINLLNATTATDCTVSATIVRVAVDSSHAGVCGRWDPSIAKGLTVAVDTSNTFGAGTGCRLVLYRNGGAGDGLLGSYDMGSMPATCNIDLQMVGTSITVRLNGIQRIGVTETSITSGFAGVRTNAVASTNVQAVAVDDFTVTSAVGASNPVAGSDSGSGSEGAGAVGISLGSGVTSTGTSQTGTPQTVAAGSGASDGLNYNAFPGLCRAPNGSLILALHHANNHVGSVTSKINVYVGTPDGLGGYAWAAPTTLRTASGINAADVGCLTLQDGRVGVYWNESTTPGAADSSTVTSYNFAYSPDSGQSWGTTTSIAMPGFPSNGAGQAGVYGIAPSVPVQLPDGSLLLSPYGNTIDKSLGEGSEFVKCMRSTDSGATWTQIGTIFAQAAGKNYDECALLVLDNGDVLAVVRSDGSSQYDFYASRSTDNGVTWSAPVRILGSGSTTGYNGRPSLVQTKNGGVLVGFRYMNAGTSSWSGYRYSNDRGVTWSAHDIDPYDGTLDRTGAVTGTGRGLNVYGAFADLGNNTVAYAWSEELGSSTSAVTYFRTITVTGGATETSRDYATGTEGVSSVNVGTVGLSRSDTATGTESSSVSVTSSAVSKAGTDSGLLSESSNVSGNVTSAALSSSDSATGSESRFLTKFGPGVVAVILNTILASDQYGSTTLTSAQPGSTTVTTADSTVIS